MTPDEIYDTLTKLLRCMMCDGEWDDDRCRECECYLGENWNMFPFLWTVRGFVRDMCWIPVTERLPEEHETNSAEWAKQNNYFDDDWPLTESENVLVTILKDDGTRETDFDFTVNGKFTEPIIAWMPLPEPWKGDNDAGVH